MEAWQIVLAVMGSIGLIGSWVALGYGFKRNWELNRVVIVLLAIVLAIAVPVAPLFWKATNDANNLAAEAEEITASFFQQYANSSLLGIEKPPEVYIAFRTDDGQSISVSFYAEELFGLNWIDVGQLETEQGGS